ncbi:MAG: beta-ketoacyl-[acyl-carrier-protein] synthase II [Chloroflexi bacterium RBG_16_64_43]|nr:MAG: beta-ketoacyl-[acyl-carrier-protein] synthase II [Chloroflexi bacterium RBG_16_64_43]
MPDHSSTTRVVITGLGAITALGLDVPQLWEGLLAGRSGIGRITQFDASGLPCQIAGEIKGFDPSASIEPKEARRMARVSQIAVASAQQALRDAGVTWPLDQGERTGVIYGTAVGGLDRIDDEIQVLRTRGLGRVSPFAGPSGLPNMPAFHISEMVGALGPNATITTACATGTQTVGEGFEWIRRGRADRVLAGGADAFVRDFAIAGFCAMRALPVHYNDTPELASRPFDKDREGFVFSEGAATLVLERLDHALARGVRIYAEIVGHASSSDAYHLAIPRPDAAGAIRTMRWALEDAGVPLEAVDYINAHGTSTEANDQTETLAIKTLFGEHAYRLAVSSTKSMIGHAMGAAGAIEALVCTLTLHTGHIHPTINYTTPDPQCDLDVVPNRAREAAPRVVMSNSFGLGGQNACLVLRRWEPT